MHPQPHLVFVQFLEKSLNQQRRCEALAKQEADLKSQACYVSVRTGNLQPKTSVYFIRVI